MFKFITNRALWVNIIAAGALAFLIIFIILKMLGWITKHDAYLKVPAVLGKIHVLRVVGFKNEAHSCDVFSSNLFAEFFAKQAVRLED